MTGSNHPDVPRAAHQAGDHDAGNARDPDATSNGEMTADQGAPAASEFPAESEFPAGQGPGSTPAGDEDWDPTGLDLARSVLGSLTNGATPAYRRGGSTPGSGGRRAAGRGPRSRPGRGVAGQAAYADIAGTSSAYPDDRDPQVLDSTIGRLVADRGWNTDVAVAGALSRWDQIVGPQVAEHCKAERYADGVLTVRADSTAWATQVRLLAATLVKRLNEDLGDGTVDRIVVQGPTGYDWRKRGLGTRDARGPRDTYG